MALPEVSSLLCKAATWLWGCRWMTHPCSPTSVPSVRSAIVDLSICCGLWSGWLCCR